MTLYQLCDSLRYDITVRGEVYSINEKGTYVLKKRFITSAEEISNRESVLDYLDKNIECFYPSIGDLVVQFVCE